MILLVLLINDGSCYGSLGYLMLPINVTDKSAQFRTDCL